MRAQMGNKRPPRSTRRPYYYQTPYIPRVIREPSINLGKEWELLTEFTKQRLEKVLFVAGDGTEM